MAAWIGAAAPLMSSAQAGAPVTLRLQPPTEPVMYQVGIQVDGNLRGLTGTTTSQGHVSVEFEGTSADSLEVVIRFLGFDEGSITAGKLFGVHEDLRELVLDAVLSNRGELIRCLPREYLGPVGTKMVSIYMEDLFVPFPAGEVGVGQGWTQELVWEAARGIEPNLRGEMAYRIVKMQSTSTGAVAKIEGFGSFSASWYERREHVDLAVKREEKLDVAVESGIVLKGKIWEDYSWDGGAFAGTRRFEFVVAPQPGHK